MAVEVDAYNRLMDLVDEVARFDDGRPIVPREDSRHGLAPRAQMARERVLDAELVRCADRPMVTLHENRGAPDTHERRSGHWARALPDDDGVGAHRAAVRLFVATKDRPHLLVGERGPVRRGEHPAHPMDEAAGRIYGRVGVGHFNTPSTARASSTRSRPRRTAGTSPPMSVRTPATTKEQIDADIQLSGRNPIARPNRRPERDPPRDVAGVDELVGDETRRPGDEHRVACPRARRQVPAALGEHEEVDDKDGEHRNED